MIKKKKDMIDEDLERINEFLEFAQASVKKNVTLEQEFDGSCVAYNSNWTRYRIVEAPVRCQLPEGTSEITELPQCARNCWKLLMFMGKPEDVEVSVKLLIPLLKSGEIKSFKHNAYRQRAVSTNEAHVIVIYTWGTEERDRLKAKLHSVGFTNIPYRRGCKIFESKFGHWKQWFKE